MRLGDLDELKKCAIWTKVNNGVELIDIKVVPLDAIDNAPTVDIKDQIAGAYNEGFMCGNREAEKARPQGEWKETGYETGALGITYRQTQCSNCGWEHALPMWLNFCPNCGAKMKKGGAE